MTAVSRTVAAAGLAASIVVGIPALAWANPTGDLAGHWNSASLRINGMGYSLSLTDASDPAGAYDGVLLFHFEDGRLGPKTEVGVVLDGSKVTLVMPGGSLASGTKTLTGTLGQDGSIFFPKCYKQFSWATKSYADKMCWFQELPLPS